MKHEGTHEILDPPSNSISHQPREVIQVKSSVEFLSILIFFFFDYPRNKLTGLRTDSHRKQDCYRP